MCHFFQKLQTSKLIKFIGFKSQSPSLSCYYGEDCWWGHFWRALKIGPALIWPLYVDFDQKTHRVWEFTSTPPSLQLRLILTNCLLTIWLKYAGWWTSNTKNTSAVLYWVCKFTKRQCHSALFMFKLFHKQRVDSNFIDARSLWNVTLHFNPGVTNFLRQILGLNTRQIDIFAVRTVNEQACPCGYVAMYMCDLLRVHLADCWAVCSDSQAHSKHLVSFRWKRVRVQSAQNMTLLKSSGAQGRTIGTC